MKKDRTKIKICDVKDIDTALFCSNNGVDFLGFHAIWELTENKSQIFQRINEKLHEQKHNTKPVLVTRQEKEDIVLHMAVTTKINIIQLHAKWSPHKVYRFKKAANNYLKNCSVICVIEPASSPINYINDLAEHADFFLFDSSWRGGTGKQINQTELEKKSVILSENYCFIAGGLNNENVSNIVTTFKPFGVDVQSGVERNGKKDRIKISEFIEAVREVD